MHLLRERGPPGAHVVELFSRFNCHNVRFDVLALLDYNLIPKSDAYFPEKFGVSLFCCGSVGCFAFPGSS